MTFAGNPNEQRRRASSRVLILDALVTAGPTGRTNGELNDISFRYGARLLELRQAGYDIESIFVGAGQWRFVLHVPARIKPGMPGFLASLPAVDTTTTTGTPSAGPLFDL
jgi:hypothetical protein